jgi:hypothetical protein
MNKHSIALGLLAAVVSTFAYVRTAEAKNLVTDSPLVKIPAKATGRVLDATFNLFGLNEEKLPRSPLSLVLIPGRSIATGINSSLLAASMGGAMLRDFDGGKPSLPEAIVGKIIYTPVGFAAGAYNSARDDWKHVTATEDGEAP